jgi:hypothetical protein
VSDHGDPCLGAAVDDSSSQGAVVVGTERNLDGRDGGELERHVQLAAVDVREAHPPHEAFVDEAGQRAHGGSPRRPRIGRVDEVEVDRQADESGEACFAVGANRLRATVRDPPAAEPRHATLRHDPGAHVRPRAAEAARQQSLVVSELSRVAAVRARCVEHGHTRLGGGRDRLESELLVTALVRRHAHAAETDAQLRGGKPSRATQATEGTPHRRRVRGSTPARRLLSLGFRASR